jgi:hypothetical protein
MRTAIFHALRFNYAYAQATVARSEEAGDRAGRSASFFHTRRAFREDFCEFFFILRDGMLFPLFTVHHKEAL